MLGFLAKRKLELGEQINPTGQAAEEPLSFHSLSKKNGKFLTNSPKDFSVSYVQLHRVHARF